MDIRTRLSLALVFVSLVSMALLGTFAYYTSANLLQEISQRQLDALAESKRRDLLKVYDGWEDYLLLVRDRTQLKQSMLDYVENDNIAALRDVERIIQGIAVAGTEIDQIIVYSIDGDEITSFGRSQVSHSDIPISEDVSYVGTFQTDEGLRVAMSTGVTLDGALVGGIELIIDASDVFDVTGDYTGLGATGEAFIVMKEEAGLRVLNPLRHEVVGFDGLVSEAEASGDLRSVFLDSEEQSGDFEAQRDYRDQWVWLATRYMDQLGWGLVVKVDAEEEEQRAKALRESLLDIAVALSAFAIIAGGLIGYYLARPIQELAVVVSRMRHGESGLRAEVKGDDEIAYLAESLNAFLSHVEQQQEQQDKQGKDA